MIAKKTIAKCALVTALCAAAAVALVLTSLGQHAPAADLGKHGTSKAKVGSAEPAMVVKVFLYRTSKRTGQLRDKREEALRADLEFYSRRAREDAAQPMRLSALRIAEMAQLELGHCMKNEEGSYALLLTPMPAKASEHYVVICHPNRGEYDVAVVFASKASWEAGLYLTLGRQISEGLTKDVDNRALEGKVTGDEIIDDRGVLDDAILKELPQTEFVRQN